MKRDPQVSIFVGIRNAVVALDDRSGAEVWRAELQSSDHVTLLWDGEALLAANGGEVWRLACGAEASTGRAGRRRCRIAWSIERLMQTT